MLMMKARGMMLMLILANQFIMYLIPNDKSWTKILGRSIQGLYGSKKQLEEQKVSMVLGCN